MATTTGTNGSTPDPETAKLPATKLLAAFVAAARPSQLTPSLRLKVKEVLLDTIGVTAGALVHAASSTPILHAVKTLQGPVGSGPCSVLAQGQGGWRPQYAGLLNAALGHSMDFDDTYAAGTLHAGVTAIPAALAAAEAGTEAGAGVASETFVLAVAVAYEVTCRIGRELGYEAYRRGFHNTGTAGVFGAVAAVAVVKGLGSEVVEMAFGLAGSRAAGSMQYLENGSWNKRLHPGFAVHDAFVCVALAEAGVVGARGILEGKNGFFKAYTPSEEVDLERLVGGLGEQWEFLKSSLKPYPACRMTHGFIELAGAFSSQRQGVKPEDVDKITLTMSPSNFILVGDPTPNKIKPENAIDAQFSAYFQVANALLNGSHSGLEAYSKLADSNIRDVCEKIRVEQDPSMQGFSSRLQVRWADGKTVDGEMEHPLGEEQHPFTRDRVDEKFLSLAVPVYGEKKAADIIRLVDGIEGCSVEDLLRLLR